MCSWATGSRWTTTICPSWRTTWPSRASTSPSVVSGSSRTRPHCRRWRLRRQCTSWRLPRYRVSRHDACLCLSVIFGNIPVLFVSCENLGWSWCFGNLYCSLITNPPDKTFFYHKWWFDSQTCDDFNNVFCLLCTAEYNIQNLPFV